ncbi:hypothetical protein [Rhizobium rhizosphaerae]|uniref:hypothetical protein n=1 Tax=Xaviernesmea rhizosphaerae TaxID=1672749 RepID=UPI00111AC711|nr:hypothetical protein [Xaviernesmea rhizosphaerae]
MPKPLPAASCACQLFKIDRSVLRTAGPSRPHALTRCPARQVALYGCPGWLFMIPRRLFLISALSKIHIVRRVNKIDCFVPYLLHSIVSGREFLEIELQNSVL